VRQERYFAAVSAAATLLVWLTLVVLIVAVSLVESAGNLAASDSGLAAALLLVGFNSIRYGFQLLPIACFVGALVAGTVLARSGELLAAQAGGVSALKLAGVFLFVVVVAAGGGAACGEVLVPVAVERGERVLTEQLKSRSDLSNFYNRRLHWFREGDLLLYVGGLDRERRLVAQPIVYRFQDGLIAEVIEAEVMRHDGNTWLLEKARLRAAETAHIEEAEVMPLELRATPSDLLDTIGDPRQMGAPEVRALVERRTKAGFDTTSHRIELHNRYALPLSAIWMFLVVAPWALHPERRRSLAVALGGGVGIIAMLLGVTHVFRALALGHKIPVALGAWGPGLVSLLLMPISFWLYQRYRVRGTIL
jgi:lipopolysaccharide export system permease protein